MVNNINDAALLYKNTTNDKNNKIPYMALKLKGDFQNINATGAKAIVFSAMGSEHMKNSR